MAYKKIRDAFSLLTRQVPWAGGPGAGRTPARLTLQMKESS